MAKVSKEIGELTVLNENNVPTKLSSFWKDRTAVFVFLRHFG